MENQELNKTRVTIVNFNKEQMKIYNFLECLSTSCKDAVSFKKIVDVAKLYKMDQSYINIINKHFLLINTLEKTRWNPVNVIDARLVNSLYAAFLKEKKIQNDIRKINKIEDSKIPSNLISVSKMLRKIESVKPQKDPYGNISEATINKYLFIMEIIYFARTIKTSKYYENIKKLKISAQFQTTLKSLCLISTIKHDVTWNARVMPCKKLATRVAQYMNAVIQKRGLPPFDITDYYASLNLVNEKVIEASLIDVERTENIIQKPAVFLNKSQTRPEANNAASINMILAQEIISKGGDKELALKLMRNEI